MAQHSLEAAMATNKTPINIVLAPDEHRALEGVARSLAAAHRDVVRAQTILRLAEGRTVSAVGREVGLARRIVCKWADRFLRKRLAGLADAPRSGRPPRFSPDRRHAPGEARL
jgi:DNA-directed RNA polymerase sigma subunit (sigma70/sigma32)